MATASRITLDEFLLIKEGDKPALEYACGEVIQKPMPSWSHAAIQIFLGSVLLPFLTRTGLGRAATEFRCIFGPTGRERAYVPDLVYIASDRLTGERYLRAAPDLAVEIVSPEQDMARLSDKIQFYLLNGVRLVWIIDPEAATIAVLAPGQEGRTLTAGDMLDGDEVLPGFSLAVDEIFAQLHV
jgi:Uma2 family endonuclease